VAHRSGGLGAVRVPAAEVPSLVDEVPVLAVVATQAEGTTRFEGVGELRVKESDRLAAIVDGLTALGATVRAGEDWLEVDGPAQLHGAELDSLGDHRLAMAWAVAALAASGPVRIERWEAIDVSYPSFPGDLAALGS
jgi:3-phosphoshikimate 1-carboxyvinyltransferase